MLQSRHRYGRLAFIDTSKVWGLEAQVFGIEGLAINEKRSPHVGKLCRANRYPSLGDVDWHASTIPHVSI